ncbi:MAG: phasin family protein [Alphaproteobacteria bacterium]|nr:phasin family protein [Alphaproteobacteria bacterium]
MDNKMPTDMSAMVSKSVEQARGAMENYLKFFQNNMSASPWAGTELNQKLTDYARQNVDAAFKLAQSLTQAKDAGEMVRIQTEYFQGQLKALTEQAKDLSETATKSMAGSMKSPFK